MNPIRISEYILIDRRCGIIDRGELSTVIRTLDYALKEEFRKGSDFEIRELLITEVKVLSTDEIADALELSREEEKMRSTV
jgi:2,3-bisphosphoglycerate-independent phosphoglycerate mutase